MKKNFVQKLALGLALVMTVTSVPATSKAAAKPAFKAASVEVEEGATVKTEIKNTKGWKAKKVVVKDGTVAEATAVQKAKKVNVKVTGLKAGETKVVTKLTNGKKVVKAKLNVTVTAKEEEKVELTATQTGSKQVTLTSSNDLTGATITVKKGANTVASTATINGKEAVITLGANIAAETYTVVVAEETTTFVGEASKVTTIELGDIAVADKGVVLPTTAAGNTATVAYRVLNQFGEDLTKSTSLTVNASMPATVSAGKVTLTLPVNTKQNDIASIVLIYTNTGVNVSKTVTISNASVVSEVAFEGIYNKEGKTLTEGTLAADSFYLLVDLKDQYGNAITDPAVANAGVIVTPAAGLTNVTFGALKKVTIGTETKLALPLNAGSINAGSVTVLLIAKNTGKNTQTTFDVANGIKVDTFSATPVDMVVGGEKAVFEFTAVDTYGNEIKHPKKEMFNTFPSGFDFEKNAKTGATELVYTAAAGVAVDTPVVTNFITKTNKVVTVNFTVKKDAYPVAITSVDEDFTPGVLAGETNVLNLSDVVFEDQYGRTMAYANAIKTINGKAYSWDVTLPTDMTTDLTVTSNTNDVTVTSVATPASVTLTLNLKEAGTLKDTLDVTFASKAINDLSNFQVKDIALVNGNVTSATATAIKVTGTASDGTLVVLPTSAYTVYGALAGTDTAKIYGYNLFTATEAVSVKESTFTVVINNATGTSIKETVKVSNEAPKAAVVKVTSLNNTLAIATSGSVTNAELKNFVVVYDQYDAVHTEAPRITVENISKDLVATNNGTTNAAITAVGAKEIVELTYEYASGVTFKTIAKLSK